MTKKELDKITEPLRKGGETHLMFVRMKKGIVLSSLANGNDIYEFLQVLVDTNPAMIDIINAVANSRDKHYVPTMPLAN